MEWLSQGTYNFEGIDPPLARIAVAMLPYLSGSRSQSHATMSLTDSGLARRREGTALFNWEGRYWHNLMLSRMGVVPFFWFGAFLVFSFMRQQFSDYHAVVAVILYAFSPVLLGHASLGTTDMAFTAMFLWSLLSCWRCIEKLTFASGLVASVSLGMACLAKFTELPFLSAAVAILIARHWYITKEILPPLINAY